MREVYGVKVTNFSRRYTSCHLCLHFKNHGLNPFEGCRYTPNLPDADGIIRKQACVHFRSKSDRDEAIRHMNGTMLGGRRLSVEPCECVEAYITEVQAMPQTHNNVGILAGARAEKIPNLNFRRTESSTVGRVERSLSVPAYFQKLSKENNIQKKACANCLIRDSSELVKDRTAAWVVNNALPEQVSSPTTKSVKNNDSPRASHVAIKNRKEKDGGTDSVTPCYCAHTETPQREKNSIGDIRATNADLHTTPTEKLRQNCSCKEKKDVVYGVKVSNLPPKLPENFLKEHFESRDIPTTEVRVYTWDNRQYFGCVHFENERRKKCAIRKINGTKLYGWVIGVDSCCCKISIGERKRIKEKSIANSDVASSSSSSTPSDLSEASAYQPYKRPTPPPCSFAPPPLYAPPPRSCLSSEFPAARPSLRQPSISPPADSSVRKLGSKAPSTCNSLAPKCHQKPPNSMAPTEANPFTSATIPKPPTIIGAGCGCRKKKAEVGSMCAPSEPSKGNSLVPTSEFSVTSRADSVVPPSEASESSSDTPRCEGRTKIPCPPKTKSVRIQSHFYNPIVRRQSVHEKLVAEFCDDGCRYNFEKKSRCKDRRGKGKNQCCK